MKSVVRFSRFVVAALFAVACQSASDDPVTDTNTNWLEVCEESDTCGGLECLCDVCTRECETDADCSGLDEGAVCSQSEESSCGGSSVCVESVLPQESSDDDGSDDSDTPDDAGSADDAVPPVTSTNQACAGDEPTCDANCGTTQAAVCLDGAWTCPPVTLIPCAPEACEGEGPSCPDGCGGTLTVACVDGSWVCPEPSAGCSVSDAGSGGATSEIGGAGGTSSGGTAGAGGTSSGGTAGAGGTSSGGTAGATVTDPCEGATLDQACEVEGVSCGNCTNPCEFCSILRCSLGLWSRMEAFPAPCFQCGMDLSCQQYEAVCRIENGAVYDEECVTVPEACRDDLSCGCLESEIPEYTCTESSEGSFVVERSDSGSQ